LFKFLARAKPRGVIKNNATGQSRRSEEAMFAALDVYYRGRIAQAAAVVFAAWAAAEPLALYKHQVAIEADYVPGRFFLRELKPLEAVLDRVREALTCIIVDGYVTFGPSRPALGRFLFDRLGGRIAVIGVAKNKYGPAEGEIEIVRGRSRRPLYITAAGMSKQAAADAIAGMHGAHRIPTLLKAADRLSKKRSAPSTVCR
jgi:deoxyribonuclease V